jgi:predicted lipoprotein with Yx(FWY)xxD motif
MGRQEVGSMRFSLLVWATVVSVTVVLLVAAGAFATSAGTVAKKRPTSVRVSTRKLPKLGAVLVNSRGLALYMFVPDKQKKVTCVNACAAVWPPLKLPKGAKPVAAGQAKASLLGSDPNPSGGRVVTYNKWPLYTYITDSKPGTANGQAINLNGGLWYVLAPSGKVIRTKP